MFWKEFLGEKCAHFCGLLLGILFLSTTLAAMGLSWKPIAFLSVVWALCVLAPLAWEYAHKLPFCRQAAGLEGQDVPCARYASMLRRPDFWEGAVIWDLLDRSERELNEKLAAVSQENREYREYVETWVHEIKTPISTLRLAGENHPGPLADRLKEPLSAIERHVEEALFYARSGSVHQDYLIRPMSLQDAINEVMLRYAEPILNYGFVLTRPQEDPLVYSDEKWVHFILGQIVANALQYRSPSPRLAFSILEQEQSVILRVADNGPGIPEKDLPRVFEKGFTGENGRRKNRRSTGLGLYLVQKLCDRLGLGVSVTSRVGEGTAVELVFPRSKFHLASAGRET